MPRAAVAARERGPASARVVGHVQSRAATRKSLPRPWCLVSAVPSSGQFFQHRGADRLGIAESRRSASSHRMRGSRRNQRSWRRAKRRVRCRASASASSSVSSTARGGRAAPCSRGPGGRSRDRPPAGEQRADLVEEPGVELRGVAGVDAGVEHRSRDPRARRAGPASVGRRRGRGRTTRTAGRCPRVTSRARTMRRRFVGSMRAGGHRVERREASVQRGGVGLGLELGAHRPGTGRGCRARRRRRAGTARCRRRAARAGRGPRCRRARRGRRAGSARRCSPRRARRRRSGGGAPRPARRGVGLAVPMSMPRYTCIESTDTISTSPTRSGDRQRERRLARRGRADERQRPRGGRDRVTRTRRGAA